MADKTINELTAATTMGNDDLLVLQQGGTAKKLSGKQLGDYVYNAAAEKVAEVNKAVDDARSSINDIVESVQSMTELGTDTTLTTTGMAADAKAAGDKIKAVETAALADLSQGTASGSIVTITDGADNIPIKKMSVDIEPVQDLHGYDHPWPAGGGRNIYPTTGGLDTKTASGITFTKRSDGGIAISGTATEQVNYSLFDESVSGANLFSVEAGTYTISVTGLTSGVQYIYGGASNTSGLPYYDFTGEKTKTVTLDAGTTGYNLIRVTNGTTVNTVVYIQWEKGSTATSWTPYSNICPITGWTGAKVTKTGFNVWDEEVELGGINMADGTPLTATTLLRSKNYISVLPNTAYYFRSPLSDTIALYAYKEDDTYIGAWASNYGWIKSGVNYAANKSITTPNDCYKLKMTLGSNYGTSYNHDVCINFSGARNGDYEQGASTTIPIAFPSEAGTVYGGSLEINQDGTGTLTVDRVKVTIDGNTVRFNGKFGNDNLAVPSVIVTSFNLPLTNNSFYGANYLSRPTTSVATDRNTASCYGNLLNAHIDDIVGFGSGKTYTTLTEFLTAANNYVNSNNLEFVYGLATPQVYTLTADQVTTLLGTNNIWSNTGDIAEFVYRKAPIDSSDVDDKIAEIESLISGRETAMKATKNYTSGGLVIVNHTIYKLDVNVASGETLVPGFNCHTTTIETELAAKVPSARTVNGKALSSNVLLTAEDISYGGSPSEHTSGSVGEVVSDLKSAFDEQCEVSGIEVYIPTLINGTVPNSGNANFVSIQDYISADVGDVFTVSTDRPLSAVGNKYIIYWYVFNADRSNRVGTFDYQYMSTDKFLNTYATGKWVKISIGEAHEDGTYNPLRYTDFNNYRVVVTKSKSTCPDCSSFMNFVSEDSVFKDVANYKLYQNLHIENGTPQNSSNSYCVRIAGSGIPVQEGDIVKVYTERPLSAQGNHYDIAYRILDSSSVDITGVEISGGISADSYVQINATGAAFIRIGFCEKDSLGNYATLRNYDFLRYNTYAIVIGKDSFMSELHSFPPARLTSSDFTFVDGKGIDYTNGSLLTDNTYSYTELDVSLYQGASIKGYSGAASNQGMAFYDADGVYISGFGNPASGVYTWFISGTIPTNAVTARIHCRKAYQHSFSLNFGTDKAYNAVKQAVNDARNNKFEIEKKLSDIFVPALRNGSGGNSSNANAICMNYVFPIDKSADTILVEYIGDRSLADEYAFAYFGFVNSTDGQTTTEAFQSSTVTTAQVNADFGNKTEYARQKFAVSELSKYDHVSFFLQRYKDGSVVPLRIATDQHNIRLTMIHEEVDQEVNAKNEQARHVPGKTVEPLTILHFSDIHGDTAAFNRILRQSKEYAVDDIICTGDIVENSYTDITSWWNGNVMTCIGNHDSASYSSGTYNWVALSMADRDTYYIAPYEDNWDIVHTSGTSYYYKDYSNQKVRLIVMDAMLYSPYEEDTTLANAQTAWLANLLDDAITNELHVIIAIHSPHDGATAIECSFSKFGQTTMPSYSDCNTPQVVIDTVASAITDGLNFVGYLVGHTHQDNVWDAENDGSQLMFCVTCSHIRNVNQWKNGDMERYDGADAYNLVTIDTEHTLVKLVRGGGADLDDHMRTRKAICFNYSTGAVVGEIT